MSFNAIYPSVESVLNFLETTLNRILKAITFSDVVTISKTLGLKLSGGTSFTWDPGNLADGAGETKSVTVAGAALGDYVLVAPPYDLQDMLLTAYVQVANTVEVRLQNETTGAVDLASGSWKVSVIPSA